MVTDLIIIVIVALICQTVVDQLKLAVKFHKGFYKNRVNLKVLTSMFVSLLLCITYQIDLLTLLGLTGGLPIIGNIITAILISGGASVTHDLISKIKDLKNNH